MGKKNKKINKEEYKTICGVLSNGLTTDIIDLTTEECAELIHANTKLLRTQGRGEPTPVTMPEALNNFLEEIADVSLCLDILMLSLLKTDAKKVKRIKFKKAKRLLQRRIEAGEFKPEDDDLLSILDLFDKCDIERSYDKEDDMDTLGLSDLD